MAQVGIHHTNYLCALIQRLFETLNIGFPQSFLALAMQDGDLVRMVASQLVCDSAGPIGTVVIHDQYIELLNFLGEQCIHQDGRFSASL